MIEIDKEKAMSLIKEQSPPVNIAEEVVKRFKNLSVDKINRLDSVLYQTSKVDFKGNEKGQERYFGSGLKLLLKELENLK